MSRLPTIPDFANDIESMSTALRTVKMAIEILGGMQQGESVGAPMAYVQAYAPDAERNGVLRVGDQWINTTDNTLLYWTGDVWRKIVD